MTNLLVVALEAVALTTASGRPTQTKGVALASRQRSSPMPVAGSDCLAAQHKTAIDQIWQRRKPSLSSALTARLGRSDPYVLYDIQSETANLLRYAVACRDLKTLDELLELYATTIEHATVRRTYKVAMGGSDQTFKLDEPARIWLDAQGYENILSSSQFTYLIAAGAHAVAALEDTARTPRMRRFLEEITPVLARGYHRWVFGPEGAFQVNGWGCDPGRFTHHKFLEHKLGWRFGTRRPVSYCNAVTDIDLWLLAGVVELLSANHADPRAVLLSRDIREAFLRYIDVGTRLMQSRFVYAGLVDFDGEPVQGGLFDPGTWMDHPEYAYSGYSEPKFPTDKDRRASAGVGWDISHGRRFVHVFETLYKNRLVTGQTFPDRSVLEALANQIVYATFNRDFQRPLFTNFMDGSNGWYRVSYDGRLGFAYAPYDLSIAVVTGGYGFWSEYNPELRRLMQALWSMLQATDPDSVAHRRKYYGGYYQSFSRVTREISDSELLEFLPTFMSP